jgi:hypothetical protein
VLTRVGLPTASVVGRASSMVIGRPGGRRRLLTSRRGAVVGGDLVVVATRLEEGRRRPMTSSEVPDAWEPFDAMARHGMALLVDGAQGGRQLGAAAGPVASRRWRSRSDEDC